MSMVNELMQKHLEIWSETNHEKRRKAIDEAYSENCRVYDPFYEEVFVGRDALMALIDDVQSKFRGFSFSIIPGSLGEHHGHIRFNWHYGPPEKPETISGQDFILLENNLIHSVTLFIDEHAE